MELLSIYDNLRHTYRAKGEAYILRELFGDMKVRGGRMRERLDVHGESLEPFVDAWFLEQPLTLDRVLSYVVGWEFPDNRRLTVQDIRQGKDSLTLREARIARLKRERGL